MSKEARGVLIKSVIQAVPAYPMSCFLFTKTQCNKLSSVSARFWWGDKEDQRKVHWIGWERMCKSKKNGGLGFRDFESFNHAFLAKQGWHLLTEPESLCARVLKARYYRENDFLSATCPKRASYTWRSIVKGRELLKEGLVWRVGDGASIRVMEDNWIPRNSAQHPLGCKEEECPVYLKDFLLPSGGAWDETKLESYFYEQDVQDILQIKVGRPGWADFRAWNYTKNGQFSVRSAYHLAMQRKRDQRGSPESSRSCDQHKGWLSLWDAQIPGKVKVHF
jgi:hypothetical protein